MSKLPKHHFVPWSYLRYFAIDPESDRKKSKICMLDKRPSVKSPIRIEKTDKVECYVRGQNTVEELDDPELFEKQYADIDAALGKIISMMLQTIRQSPENLCFNPENKVVLSNHIMLLFKRQPTVFRDAHTRVINAFDIVKEKVRAEYDGLLPAPQIEDILKLKSTKQYALKLSMDLIGDGVEALQNKVWIYCHNKTNIPFITSDYPLCPQFLPSYSGCGMADPGCIFRFPVAPDALIYMVDQVHFASNQVKYYDNAIEPVRDRNFVLMANYLQYINCTNQVYSHQTLIPSFYIHPDKISDCD